MKRIIISTLTLLSISLTQNTLIIPDTLSGTDLNLTLQNGTFSFYEGISTTTMGANGNILGPTLIMNNGDFVDIKVTNQLADTTTIHWHGMHVSSENDGGPHTTIAPGVTWNPKFSVLDKAGTYWYHPHLHEKTNLHVSKGIAGFIIVRDSEEAALNLPRTYGIDDFPLVFQTKTFDSNKEIVVPSNADSVLMVNATINATLDVPAQVVRFRLLDGSSQRVFNIGLSDNRSFSQIGSDGGLLESSNTVTRLQLAPGERAEVLIDFSSMEGETISLMSYASEFGNGIYGATYPGMGTGITMDGYNPNVLNGNDFSLIEFKVVSPTSNPITSIPETLVAVTPLLESDVDTTRSFTLSAVAMGPNALNGDFLINGASFKMDEINEIIPLNNTEIWSITNQSPIAHPFHIHDVQFYILDRDGVKPSKAEAGRKDVVLVNPQETVRFITEFRDFADDAVPYMYHCHMLTHEDQGMMGQFIVVDMLASVDEFPLIAKEFSLHPSYPNPFNPKTIIKYELSQPGLVALTIYNISGQEVATLVKESQSMGVYKSYWSGKNDIGRDMPSGIYFYTLKMNGESRTRKMVLMR
ncbi:MAG: multicopper oxidase domain-containing protein [Candidatus Marinimicrobia bacterium]|nr:multicopper oxidase domain-containing protein [Candidatus Neomarinimicrobiota bacterium]MBL7010911.1 multicopper oxidase domain-containing protein [Candidatus Neomarinimicrobiota bacterium]MBL7031347.1 multicopper oxidase domain-containing protein [Candidatus Neomarinimicrobiota bacterium]